MNVDLADMSGSRYERRGEKLKWPLPFCCVFFMVDGNLLVSGPEKKEFILFYFTFFFICAR